MDFISLPVTVGFTAAAAFTIASAQIKNFLGLKVKSSNEVVDSWFSALTNLDKISWPDTLLGCATIVALLLGRVNKIIYYIPEDHLKSKMVHRATIACPMVPYEALFWASYVHYCMYLFIFF